MPGWEDFIDADVMADAEVSQTSKMQLIELTLLKRLLGIKSLGDALTDPGDPSDPNGFYKLIQAMGEDTAALVAAMGDDATAGTLLYVHSAIASLLAIGNTNTATIATKLAAIDTDLQAIAAVLAIGNTNTAVIAAQLVSVNTNLGDLVTETANNS